MFYLVCNLLHALTFSASVTQQPQSSRMAPGWEYLDSFCTQQQQMLNKSITEEEDIKSRGRPLRENRFDREQRLYEVRKIRITSYDDCICS